jgi:tRNA (adenine37-N6)-methyltransferase
MPNFEPIGIIRTPFPRPEGTPIQPAFARQARGEVILEERYADALLDLEGFERIWLIYWWHLNSNWKPRVIPFRDTREHGLFATRVPKRPNAIGFSCVSLLKRVENTLQVGDIDVVDGTPLLDIKPYVPKFDAYPDARAGWLDECGSDRVEADGRFG